MKDITEDAQLLRAYQDGDVTACKALTERYRGLLRTVFIGNRLEHLADDLTQQVFVILFTCTWQESKASTLQAYVRGIANHLVADAQAKQGTRGEALILNEPMPTSDGGTQGEERLAFLPDTQETPEESAMHTSVMADLTSALERCLQDEKLWSGKRSQYRTILLLQVSEEVPLPEVANDLGVPYQTAHTQLKRARQILANCMRQYGFEFVPNCRQALPTPESVVLLTFADGSGLCTRYKETLP